MSESHQDHRDTARHLLRISGTIVLVFAVFVLCTPPAGARDVRVGLAELRPSQFTDEHGEPAGIFVDLIRDIAAQEGWNLVWIHGTLQENFDRLSAGDIDLMMAVVDTPDRERRYDFNREQAISSWLQVYARRGSGVNTILDLEGKRVAMLKGDVNGEAFREYAQKFGIHPGYLETDTIEEVFARTSAGDADAGVALYIVGQDLAKKYGLSDTPVMLFPSSLGFAVPKGKNGDLLTAIDTYLQREKGDPTSFYSRTMQKWMGERAGYVVPPLLVWGFATAAGAAILFVVTSIVLRREVRRKTAELTRQNEELVAAYGQLAGAEEAVRKNYEDLRKSEDALMHARKKLNLLNALTFGEIRNRIFSLTGYIQLAGEAESIPEARVRLLKSEEILRSVSCSLAFADKYQNLGLGQPRWQDVNLVLINAISHLDFSRITRTVRLDGLEIYADPLFEDVFLTIMENILVHGAGASAVTVGYSRQADGITILIEDNGRGIPDPAKEAIFSWERARQGSTSLFLSREILSITGISIRETGIPGSGARFEIAVPRGMFRFPAGPGDGNS